MIILILQVQWFWKLPRVTRLVWGGTGLVPRGLRCRPSSPWSRGLRGGAPTLNPVYAVPRTVPAGQEARRPVVVGNPCYGRQMCLCTYSPAGLKSSAGDATHGWVSPWQQLQGLVSILFTSCCAFLSLASSCPSAALL